MLQGCAKSRRAAVQPADGVQVVGVHAGQPFLLGHRLGQRCAAAQPPHLFVPMHVARLQVHLPGAQAGAAGGQGHTLLRALQRQLGALAFGDVDDDAKDQRPVGTGLDLGTAEELAHAAVRPQRAKAVVHALGATMQPALHRVLEAGHVAGVDVARQPVAQAGHRLAVGEAKHHAQLIAPDGALLAGFVHPVTDAGGAGHGLEAAGHLVGATALLLALGEVQRHAQEGDGAARGGVPLHHAPQQLRAPAAVGVAVARFDIDRLAALQRLLGRLEHPRQIVGVHHRAHLVQAQAFRPGCQSQRGPALGAVVHALSDEVVAPDCDAAHGQGQRQRVGRHRCARFVGGQGQQPAATGQRRGLRGEAACAMVTTRGAQRGLAGAGITQRLGGSGVGPQQGPVIAGLRRQGTFRRRVEPDQAALRIKLQQGQRHRVQQFGGIGGDEGSASPFGRHRRFASGREGDGPQYRPARRRGA